MASACSGWSTCDYILLIFIDIDYIGSSRQKKLLWHFYLDMPLFLVRREIAGGEPLCGIFFQQIGSKRVAWYVFSFLLSPRNLSEVHYQKPLAMYFFRKSHALYTSVLDKELSPSFWESEDKDPEQWRGFDAVLPGIEHELGRLMYTTGDTAGAVRYFLSLLRGTPPPLNPLVQVTGGLGLSNGGTTPSGKPSTDKVYLEDFRVAFKVNMLLVDQWRSLTCDICSILKQLKPKDGLLWI